MAWAFGNAAVQSSGLVESLPHMAKSLAVGNSARNGILAALLAKEGVTGGEHAIEGPFGFARVMGQDPDLAAVARGLGRTWELAAVAYKPYPTGVVLHPVIDACLELRRAHGIRAADVDRIAVRGNPLLRQRADRPAPRNGREASLSVHHCCAVAFVHGAAGLPEFTDQVVAEPAVAALRQRVELAEDAATGVEQAHVTVWTAGGASVTKHVTRLRGSPEYPMTDEELEAKFLEQAAIGAPACDARRIAEAIRDLDAAGDVGEIARMMSGGT
jgi:2-methylcitrate dehydratase PrpD